MRGEGVTMRAAIYARYSSENQRETSIEDQVRLCREEATRHGYTVEHVWQDAELSGQLTKRRPGLQAMLAAAKRVEFDVLIVDDASRLSRDGPEAQKLLKRLEFHHVGLIARSDGINTVQNAKSSRMIFGVKSVFNEEFLRGLAENTWRGLEGRVKSGFSAGGLPYGYRSVQVPDPSGKTDRYGNPVVIGYKRIVHEPEAEVVRRIFRLYVGDETGRPYSPRQIAARLNEEGVSPPGARWKNREARLCRSWSFTGIIGHRRLRKGILNNPLYIGTVLWNRSKWMRDPETESYTYRVRPQDDWVSQDDQSLRIVPQDLWEKVQARFAAQRVTSPTKTPRNLSRYLLSGFVKCGVCGGNYVIASRHSYRCSTFRNRGASVCTNHLTVSRKKLEQIVIEAIRSRLYTPENIATLIAKVRDLLLEKARQHERQQRQTDTAATLRTLDAEIEHIKKAVTLGKATATLLEMLEVRVRERDSLTVQAGPQSDPTTIQERLQAVLERLPDMVQGCMEDLEALLAAKQVEKGKDLLASLIQEVVLHPVPENGSGPQLEAEIKGDIQRVLTLQAARARGKGQLRWLGEEDSNPR